MKAIQVYCAALVSIVIFGGCKKDDTGPQQECQISSLSLNGTAASNFSYDEKGRVSVITKGDETTAYSYTIAGYVKQIHKSNKLIEKSIAELNAQGRVQKVNTQIFDLDGNNTYNLEHRYEYNGNGEIVKSISKSGNNPENTTTYSWSDGNLVSTSAGVTYTYYTDRVLQQGDILYINQLLNYGGSLIMNKNLVKSVSNNGNTTNIDYEIDSNGRIVKCLMGNDYYIIQHVCL